MITYTRNSKSLYKRKGRKNKVKRVSVKSVQAHGLIKSSTGTVLHRMSFMMPRNYTAIERSRIREKEDSLIRKLQYTE